MTVRNIAEHIDDLQRYHVLADDHSPRMQKLGRSLIQDLCATVHQETRNITNEEVFMRFARRRASENYIQAHECLNAVNTVVHNASKDTSKSTLCVLMCLQNYIPSNINELSDKLTDATNALCAAADKADAARRDHAEFLDALRSLRA